MKSFNEHAFSRRQFVKLGGGSAVALVLAGCASGGSSTGSDSSASDSSSSATSIKPGFITLHDENSTYDLNFINAAKEACQEQDISEDTYMLKTNVPQFCHSTGTKAHTEGLDNYHNAFASIYEGRYLAGVAAGMKLNEMIDSGKITADQAKMGYVGAYTYAEVISGYTSFYLGAKSVCPSVTMEVTFTGSWYDETAEKEGATKLINDGASSFPSTQTPWVPLPPVKMLAFPTSPTTEARRMHAPTPRFNWVPYYKFAIRAVMDGSTIDTDWTGTLSTGSVELTDLNSYVAADGTQDKLDEVNSKLEDGSLHVFDTSTFTVKGAKLDSYKADVDTDANYTPDTEVVSDGYFHESEYRSAPYFDVQIDGIELLDTAF